MTEPVKKPWQFQPGNELWRLSAQNFQRGPKYENPEDLFKAVLKYFEWLEENPLYDTVYTFNRGELKTGETPKMHAATLAGVCLHIGVTRTTWADWKANRPDLKRVIEWAEDALYEQKFTGASAGLLNCAIIARDLGLVDKKLVGSDPENPLPQAVTIFTLPDNER